MSTTQPDDVGLILEGKEFRFWQDIELVYSIDGITTVNFNAPFHATQREFRETFRPFTYYPMKVTLGGQPMFTGTVMGINPKADASSSRVEVNGYARIGVLSDCNPPATSVPHEFRKVGFRAIAEYLLKPFGLTVQVRGDEGAKFDRVKIKEDDEIFPFLTELAKQRTLILTDTPDGMLLAWRSVPTGNPVARLKGNAAPVTSVSASFDSQEYYSEITGYSRARRGRKGAKYTAKNRWLPNVLRPLSFHLDDTEKAEAPEATKAKLGRMFGNMASYSVDLPTWRDPKGNVWATNTTLLLTAPDVMVYRETEFLIRKVTLRQNGQQRTATLELCLPGSFSAEEPAVLPWDED